MKPISDASHPKSIVSSRRLGIFALKAIMYIFLAVITIVVLFPFYWMFITAVRPLSEIYTSPPILWPREFQWHNFAETIEVSNFHIYFRNSGIVTFFSTALTVSINLLGGYAFAKYDFRFKEILFMLVLTTLMIPLQVIMIPSFIIVSRLGFLNTYAGLAIPPSAEAFGLFLSRQFMSAIPNELIEAGRIDGATEFGIFRTIVLPNSRALCSVLIIFTAMWRWNDFQWPLIIVSDANMFTVQLGLAMLNAALHVNPNHMMAAALMSVIPLVVVFLIFQRQFIQGIASTGIKG